MKSTKPRKPFILVQDSDDTFFLIKLIDITLPTGLILLSFPMNRVNNQTPKNTITHVPNKSVRKFLSLPWLCSLDCNFPYHWEIVYHLSMFLFPNLLPLIRWSFLLLYSFFVNIFLHYLGSAFVNCTPQLCLPVTFLIIGKCILIATSFLLCYCWYIFISLIALTLVWKTFFYYLGRLLCKSYSHIWILTMCYFLILLNC